MKSCPSSHLTPGHPMNEVDHGSACAQTGCNLRIVPLTFSVVASGGGGEGLSRREWAALVTRLGEKRLLHAVVGELRGEPSGGLEDASPP